MAMHRSLVVLRTPLSRAASGMAAAPAGWDTGTSGKAPLLFHSRRSAVLAPPGGGMVASTQPLACNIGLDVLKGGGNAMDAAVAMAAALNGAEFVPRHANAVGGSVCSPLHSDGAHQHWHRW